MRQFILALAFLACFLPEFKLYAQADLSMATHWYNRANYNPASIVRTDYIYLFSNVRQQWLGVVGAPKVINLQGSEYVNDIHSAFGISLAGEKIGATQAYNPMVTYAYRLSNNQSWSLAMGLSLGIFTRFINNTLLVAETSSDPSLNREIEKITRPDANVGLEFQTKYFIGSISSTHILSVNKTDLSFLNTTHYYGSVIYKNSNFELFNYHIGLQVVNQSNLTVLESNLNIRFKRPTGLQSGPREIFDLGFTYRTSQEMILLIAFNVTSYLRIGYAFGQSFNIGYDANGTHELMLEYRIPSKAASTRGQFENQEYWYH